MDEAYMELKKDDVLHGYTVTAIDDLEEYHGKGIRLSHNVTGMDVYHVFNDDPENLFAFGFKTPPTDDTGVAHILEHTVLSGSKNYPVKDPFLALMRGSVNTFLNAMTYPDKTVYPAATTVKRDYFNLMSVYGDAVFFPLLKRELFLQEGRRFVPRPDGGLAVEGIVFNEMKGNYSSFDSIVGDWSYRSLFEQSEYRHDSGGDPVHIPGLTYEDFVAFHKKYYHPTNCLLFLYGDIPTEEQLRFIQERFLREFDKGEKADEIYEEPRWQEPRIFSVKGPSADSEEEVAKPTVTVNWLTGRTTDPLTLLSLQVLNGILLGHPGTPIQKLIDDTDIGEDMSPASGLESDIRDVTFTIGIRGIKPEKAGEFEGMILKELNRLAVQGLPADVVEGTLRRVEFRNREIKGGDPFGLRLMNKALKGWLHGSSPLTTLEFSPHMEELKRRYREEPRYFEKLIETYLLENSHRTTVTIVPDGEYIKQLDESIASRVEEIHRGFSRYELEIIEGDLEAFQKFQDTPDTEEALATIPVLSREDLPEYISIIESVETAIDGTKAYNRELFTNGIIYIDYVFNLSGLDAEERQLMTLLSRMLSSPGIPGMTYDEVSRQLNLKTGGVYPHLEVSPVIGNPDRYMCLFILRMKCLPDSLQEALDLTSMILQEAMVGDEKRLWDILTEFRNDMKSAVIPAGHSFSVLRAGAHLNPALRLEDDWRGISQLLFLNTLPGKKGAELRDLGDRLKRLREKIIDPSRLLLNVSAEGEDLQKVKNALAAQIAGFRSGDPESSGGAGSSHTATEWCGAAEGEAITSLEGIWESMQIPAAVGYSGMALPGRLYGSEGYAAQILVAHLLKTDYLWQKIRMQGGAYGAAASTHGLEGVFSFLSYRDPHVDNSLQVYLDSLQYIAEQGVSSDELEKAIIAVVGKDARPKSPSEKSVIGLKRSLYGITDELRRQTRREILETTQEDLKRAAADLLETAESASRVVLADAERLTLAEEKMKVENPNRLVIPL